MRSNRQKKHAIRQSRSAPGFRRPISGVRAELAAGMAALGENPPDEEEAKAQAFQSGAAAER